MNCLLATVLSACLSLSSATARPVCKVACLTAKAPVAVVKVIKNQKPVRKVACLTARAPVAVVKVIFCLSGVRNHRL